MKIDDKISKIEFKKISRKIRDDIYRPAYTFKNTIFLCGADMTQKNKMRYKVAQALKNSWRYSFYFDIVFPEDIFDELLHSTKTADLLSLENLLADSVDAIVLIPESPGSFTELGAFANDERLRTKLICLIDKRYKKNKSFINQGPLKLVKKANKNGIIYIDPNEIDETIAKLISALKKIKKVSSKKSDVISLLQLDNYLLPSIYLLEPVSKEILIELVKTATDDMKYAFQTTTTALTILTKKRKIELTNDGYKLTKLGVEYFLTFRKTRNRNKNQNETVKIDNLRLEILNYKYRKKKLKV